MINKINPYSNATPQKFWRTGVVEKINSINFDIYQKKFIIDKNYKIATAGSCFAQHIGNRLKANKYNVLDYEASFWSLPLKLRSQFGCDIYSARYGNIYTVRQMLQLVKEAFGISTPKNIIWKTKDGKFIDALRPGIHHKGLDSAEEVIFHRKHHISRVKELLLNMDLLIFTLGLTEAWVDKKSGTVYPTVPGSLGGEFDSNIYEFVNFDYSEIARDLIELMTIIDDMSNQKKYLFTVSPVPLTATGSSNHVLVATTYSKSVLRAVVGSMYDQYQNVDYFPSYEIVINPWSNTKKYESNQRSVLSSAVDEVMQIFLKEHSPEYLNYDSKDLSDSELDSTSANFQKNQDDVICEEVLLELLNKDIK